MIKIQFPAVQGCNFEIPKPYKGFVLQESQTRLDEDSERHFKTAGTFESFTYWNYDKVPSNGDALKQTLQFIPIANELARPVAIEEIEDFLKENKEN